MLPAQQRAQQSTRSVANISSGWRQAGHLRCRSPQPLQMPVVPPLQPPFLRRQQCGGGGGLFGGFGTLVRVSGKTVGVFGLRAVWVGRT